MQKIIVGKRDYIFSYDEEKRQMVVCNRTTKQVVRFNGRYVHWAHDEMDRLLVDDWKVTIYNLYYGFYKSCEDMDILEKL
mgnify:CR=1 FL=1